MHLNLFNVSSKRIIEPVIIVLMHIFNQITTFFVNFTLKTKQKSFKRGYFIMSNDVTVSGGICCIALLWSADGVLIKILDLRITFQVLKNLLNNVDQLLF